MSSVNTIIIDELLFLAEASKILATSLDYNTTLRSIANLAVSKIAYFCIIDLLKEDGQMERVAVKVADPKKSKLANRMFHYPPDPNNKEAIYDAARTGKPILIKKISQDWLDEVSKLSGEHEIIRKLKLNSHIFVPLKSRGRIIGVLTIASNDPNFSYSKYDLVLVEELARRAAIAVDNARLYQEAQEAVRARDEFLSIASHELKTPLTSILLQLQTILKKIQQKSQEKPSVEQVVALLQNTEHQSKRLSKLINDLLNVSLVSTGRLQLEKERGNLSDTVKDVVKQYVISEKYAKSKVYVKTNGPLQGSFDKVRMEQVVSNLLSNALKYGKGNPVTIKTKKVDTKAQVTVKDEGIGIKPEVQATIFDRFKRGVSGKDYKGLGVGLYISKQIIEAHGGNIKLKSKEGKGTTFTIELPLRK